MIAPKLRIHVQIDQPNNPPKPGGPPDFVDGGQVRPGQIFYGEIWTMKEDGEMPEPHVPCIAWMVDAAGRRISGVPDTYCRTDHDGKIEIYCKIPSIAVASVSFEPQNDGFRKDRLCMFTFMAMRLVFPYRSDAITVPVYLG
jgi:hypothetical protein